MRFNITGKQANLLLMIVSLIWGSGFVFYKNATEILSPIQFVVLRSGVAALCSVVCFVLFIKKATQQELKCGCVLGAILSLAGIIQTYGIQMTTAGKCAFLTGTNVVMVPFIAWILTKQRPSIRNVVCAVMMFTGVCLLTVNFNEVTAFNFGDGLSFLGAVMYALHIAATGKFTQYCRPVALTLLQFIFLFLFSLPLLMLDPAPLQITTRAIVLTGYLGAATIFIGHSLQTICQEHTDASSAAILLSLEGVFGSLFSALFLGERYSTNAIFAFTLIFGSIVFSQIGASQKQIDHKTKSATDKT